MNIDRKTDVIIVLAAGISAVATSFAIYATGQQFLVSSFNRILLEYLPGWFVAEIIHQFGDVALELSLVFSGFVLSVILGTLALSGVRLGSRVRPSAPRAVGFVLATGLVFLAGIVVVRSALAIVVPALVGAVIATYFETGPGTLETPPNDADQRRRTLVKAVSAVAAFNVVAHALGLVRRSQTQRSERELQDQAARLEAEHMVSEARDLELEAEGIKPLVTDIEDFYTVDINPSPPTVDTDDWRLSITGLVEEDLEVDYDDVRDEETVHRFKSIRCLSDDIDGNLLDTAVWTGTPLTEILEDAGPQGEYAMLYGEDDYYYSVPLSWLEDAMLAYGMNGLELPEAHGYPVRVLVPDRWGKLQVKWIREIEIIDAEDGGYWEDRGWNGMAPVNAVTKIDRINRPGDRIQVCGHAYAGARGVETVEVTLDGGESWEEATLSEPLPDPDTTRQWVYEFEPDQESYDFYARTIDGDGEVQTEERTGPRPSGATGWIHRTIRP